VPSMMQEVSSKLQASLQQQSQNHQNRTGPAVDAAPIQLGEGCRRRPLPDLTVPVHGARWAGRRPEEESGRGLPRTGTQGGEEGEGGVGVGAEGEGRRSGCLCGRPCATSLRGRGREYRRSPALVSTLCSPAWLVRHPPYTQ